jgi:hypothetical protein
MSTINNNKMRTPSAQLSLVLVGLTVCFSYGQSLTSFNPLKSNEKAKEVMQANEFERGEIGLTGDTYYCNPLLLDGKSLDYGNFTINTKGELALLRGALKSSKATKIPFFVHLRRDDKILDDKNMDFLNKEYYEIEISKVLAFSKPGDQLIIDPVNKEDWLAKRILKLIL